MFPLNRFMTARKREFSDSMAWFFSSSSALHMPEVMADVTILCTVCSSLCVASILTKASWTVLSSTRASSYCCTHPPLQSIQLFKQLSSREKKCRIMNIQKHPSLWKPLQKSFELELKSCSQIVKQLLNHMSDEPDLLQLEGNSFLYSAHQDACTQHLLPPLHQP